MRERAPQRPPYRQVANPARRNPLAILLGALFAVVILVALGTILLPHTIVTRVVVNADFEIPRRELVTLAGLDRRTTIFAVRPGRMAQRLESHPLVREAAVTREFPDAVRITLERRRPVALAFLNAAGGVVPVAIDRSGVLFDRGTHLAGDDLPVISGLRVGADSLGGQVPSGMVELLESLATLRMEAPELYALLSEIRVEPRAAGRFDYLLFTVVAPVPIRFSDAVSAGETGYALLVLDVLARQGVTSRVRELDVRSGEIVYRMEEGASGG